MYDLRAPRRRSERFLSFCKNAPLLELYIFLEGGKGQCSVARQQYRLCRGKSAKARVFCSHRIYHFTLGTYRD